MTIDDEHLLRELLQTFQVEAVEHIQHLNQALLKLERQPDEPVRTEMVREAFRAAHSLKGAARAVGLIPVEKLAHAVEDVLKNARDKGAVLDPDTCDILYTALDAIQSVLNGQTVDDEALVARLSGQISDTPHAEAATPSPEPVVPTAPPESSAQMPSASAASSAPESEDTIRVGVGKLDTLMAQAGELLITRISAEQRVSDMQTIRQQANRIPRVWRDIRSYVARINGDDADNQRFMELLAHFDEHLRGLTREINTLDAAVNRDAIRLGMVTNRLQSEMRRVRMVPFITLDGLFQRTVRDAARSSGKQASLEIEGGDTELDKKVLESLKDPLLHLLRNAVSHGIETPDEREANGKPPLGCIMILITQRGSEAHITIRDDGRGFDLERLRQSAEAHTPRANGDATPEEIINLAFLPGVTTSTEVTSISGRGVGLDVVRQQIDMLQGRVLVENKPGQGAAFQLIVPVSLAMTRVLLVCAGGQKYALPLAAVEKIIAPKNTFSVEGQTMVTVDNRSLPLVPLATILHLPEATMNESLAVIMGTAEQRVALMVDDVLTEQELAVKPFSKPIMRVANLAGAAVLGSGEPVVVLNTADLVKSTRGIRVQPVINDSPYSEIEEKIIPHVLVVDDSITTRTLEKNILEAAGYEVTTATDGVQAIEQLKARPAGLVVADIEMPNMDGFTLTRYLRDSKDFKDIPIILVTSLESPEDRERGMMAGANAYIVKRGFNQAELLSTIRQFFM